MLEISLTLVKREKYPSFQSTLTRSSSNARLFHPFFLPIFFLSSQKHFLSFRRSEKGARGFPSGQIQRDWTGSWQQTPLVIPALWSSKTFVYDFLFICSFLWSDEIKKLEWNSISGARRDWWNEHKERKPVFKSSSSIRNVQSDISEKIYSRMMNCLRLNRLTLSFEALESEIQFFICFPICDDFFLIKSSFLRNFAHERAKLVSCGVRSLTDKTFKQSFVESLVVSVPHTCPLTFNPAPFPLLDKWISSSPKKGE